MSGLVTSGYEMARDMFAHMLRARETRQACEALGFLLVRIGARLEAMPKGLRDSFPEITGPVEEFLATAKAPEGKHIGMATPEGEVAEIHYHVRRLIQEAARHDDALAILATDKADDLARSLSIELAACERDYATAGELLELWAAPEQAATWKKSLEQFRGFLTQRNYAPLGEAMKKFHAEFNAWRERAEQYEIRHQQRRYVLTALHKVCEARGFQCIEKPKHADPADRASAVTVVYDTIAKGRVAFTLALDGIHAESEIGGASCFEDFEALSAGLEELFGVKTAFRHHDHEQPEDVAMKGVGGQIHTVARMARHAGS